MRGWEDGCVLFMMHDLAEGSSHRMIVSLFLSSSADVGPPGPVDNSDLVQEVHTASGSTQLRLPHNTRGAL